MNSATQSLSKSYIVFQAFKYIIYVFLCYNVVLFFQGDHLASIQTYPNGMQLSDIIIAFSASIDTLAWVILLFVFELETFILSDEKLNGIYKWPLIAAKAISYIFIFYAAYGYAARLMVLLNTTVFQIDDVCTLIGSSFTYIVTLDEYVPITETACHLMNTVPLWQVNGTDIIGTEEALTVAQNLGWIDVSNSFDWLLIVAVLEADIYLQLKGRYTGRIKTFSNIIKPILYAVLMFNAVYWGINGDFVDFWDAFLWLLAFFFIEMNFFEWQAETTEAKESSFGDVQ